MKKKKGSSLVLVLVLTTAILMVGTAAMTSVSSNVKSKVEENKRVQSLYGADAGLEYANNLVIKTYDSATRYAEKIVQDEIQRVLELNTDSDSSGMFTAEFDEQLNKMFQRAFIDFINIQIGEADEVTESNEFVESIKSGSYIKLEDESLDKERVYVDFVSSSEQKPTLNATNVENITYRDANPFTLSRDKYEFTVVSEFQSVEQAINNTREVEVTYQIEIPEYRGQYTSQTVDIFKVFKDKVVSVDENIEIKNGVNVVFDGEVFAVGKEHEEQKNLVYDKYKGGIWVDGAQASFKKDVMTAKTLNVFNHGNAILSESLYARNIYVGKTDGSNSTGNITIVKDAVLDNDLTLKAVNSKVEIGNFYGLNDKTYSGQIITETDNKPGNKPDLQVQKVDRVSSSIIVNGNENTTLKIHDSAYILGVAYINTLNKQYQTGESVAIKGNYVAYSNPLPESSKFSDASFSYYEPLQLVDSMNGEALSVLEKSEYFKEFYETSEELVANDGGVELPMSNVYTAGAIVYKNNNQLVVEKSTYNSAADDEVNKKRGDYAMNVYEMGHTNKDKINLYHTLGLNDNQTTVSGSIDWGTLKENCKTNTCETNKIKLIPTEGKIVVLGANANGYSGDQYVKFDTSTYDHTSPTGPQVEAIIIVDGDVIIDGAVEFTGNIIATGSIELKGGGNQNLTYNAATTNRIIAANYEAFKDIFLGEKISTQLVNQFENHDSIQYTPDQFVKTKNWKIIR